MKAQKKKGKRKNPFGLFLFFVVGLFILQIIFAFTIHGDIGPQTDVIPSIDKPASPFLVGRIDSLVGKSNYKVARKVLPEGAFAPASRKISEDKLINLAKIDTKNAQEIEDIVVRQTAESRFYEYTVRAGDTLEKISRKLYGNGYMVQALIRLNRILDEKTLQIGASLLVPKNGLLNTIKVL